MNRNVIRTLVRTWLNEPTPGLWSDAELNIFINIANQKVNTLIASILEDFFTVSATFDTVSGTKSYELPSDFRFMRRLEIYDPNNANDIEKVDEARFPRTEGHGSWPVHTNGRPSRYIIRGDQMDFIPIPDGIYNMRIYYDARKSDLALDSDSPSSPTDFHDAIALYAAIQAYPKNHESPDELIALYRIRQEDLIQSLIRRKGDDPQMVEAYL